MRSFGALVFMGTSLRGDGAGCLLVSFSDFVELDRSTGPRVHLHGRLSPNRDTIVACYDASGELAWATATPAQWSNSLDLGLGDDLWLVGSLRDTNTIFDAGTLTSHGGLDGFFVRLWATVP
jgi:hypothetical protein